MFGYYKKYINVQYIFDANAIYFIYFVISIIQAIIYKYICNGLSYGPICGSAVVLSRAWVLKAQLSIVCHMDATW